MAPTAREIRDAEELLYLEYWCKLTFRSTELHVKQAWSLADVPSVDRLRAYAEKLQGPIVYSLIDVEDILGEEATGSKSWSELIDAGRLDADWKHFEFPVGSLESPHRSERQRGRKEAKAFLICKVALGRGFVVKEGPPKFLEFFSSCLVRDQASILSAAARGADTVDPVADWQQVYRVRSGDQVLPFALCEVFFEDHPAVAKPLICEYCEQRPASVYCKNDNAHFCAACDATHHSENEFFARHQRFSLEHSPLQFGFCRQHPSERHESVCLQCKTMLCRMCNKFGDHARKEHEGHTLMSTVEAFQQAMQGSTESDLRQEKHLGALRDALQDRHIQLTEVHHNFQETQHQMDGVLRGALDQLERAQSRKLEFLQSMKRQVTTQLLFIQWLDNFQAHARMALPPAEFVVATKRHEGLLAALFGSSQGAIPKGAELGLGSIPAWVNEELLLEGQVAVKLASLPPPIPEPGPAAPKPAAHVELELRLPNGKAQAVEEPGTSYLEATPRAGRSSKRVAAPSAGIAGVSDTLYVAAKPKAVLEDSSPGPLSLPAPQPPTAMQPDAHGLLDKAAVSAVEQVPNQNARAEFDGYISQAFAYLDEAQKRMEARMGVLPPQAASTAVPPRVPSLQLATEVLVQLRQGAEQLAGPPKPWGQLLMLLGACPGGERQELLLKALRVAAPMGDTAGQLARAVVEDDVQRTQVPSLLVSANGLHSALTQALQRLGGATFMEKEISILVREVELSPAGAAGSSAMHLAVENFIKSMIHALRSGQGHVHPSLTSLCHLVYSAAELKFGILAAQNAVLTLLLSRVVTPSILRARPAGGAPLPERVSELSRLLQRIAHFAHHEDESARGQASVPDLTAVLKHVASLRELVSRVLALPPDAQMGLTSSPEDSEAAALWIVETCRRWSAGVPSVPSIDTAGASPAGDPPGRARQQQQLQLCASSFARLGDLAHASQAMPHPPRGAMPSTAP